MIYALLLVLGVIFGGLCLAVRRAALAAVGDVRAAQRQIARLHRRLAALEPADPAHARLSARLADVVRVEEAFRARGRRALAGWRRPIVLGLGLDAPE